MDEQEAKSERRGGVYLSKKLRAGIICSLECHSKKFYNNK